MSSRLRFLGAERRAERVDPSERRRRGLTIELSRLCQVCVAQVEVFRRKEPASFADRGGQDWSVDPDEVSGVEKVVDRLLDFRADLEDRNLARAAEPQVSMLHQEIDAVLLWLNRVIDGTRADDLQTRDSQLDASRRPGLLAHGTGQHHT